MSKSKQSRGRCSYCDRELAKGGMIRHLAACPTRNELTAAANSRSGASETIYHLRAEDAWQPDFWLNLEMAGSIPLSELDHYLRHIWLDCCGHMSRFSERGWGSPDIAMTRRADQLFRSAAAVLHQYDFGTTSETVIKVVASRTGRPVTGHPIALMARNQPPEQLCIQCGQPAGWLCQECLFEDLGSGLLCDAHVESHPHDEYGSPLPLVNSPRLGMCGYAGPADPPY